MSLRIGSMLLLCLAASACCQDEMRQEARSPGGRRVAAVSVRNCGATADYAVWVTLRTRRWWPTSSGEPLFVIDSNHGQAPYAAKGGPWLEVQWMNEHRLHVRYDARARTFRQDSIRDGVHISYETVWPDSTAHLTSR